MKQTKQSLFWDYDTEVRLIQLYEERPVLWNPQHPDYQKVPRKNEEINRISSEIDKLLRQKDKTTLSSHGNAVEEVKRKWKNLRDSFIREEKKIRSLQGYQSEWKHYSALLFLREIGKKRFLGALNLTVDVDPIIDPYHTDLNDIKGELLDENEQIMDARMTHSSIMDQEDSTPALPSEESLSEDVASTRSSPDSHSSSKRARTSDDCDERPRLFGRYVASALQKMEEEDMECAIRRITQVLFKYRATRQRHPH